MWKLRAKTQHSDVTHLVRHLVHIKTNIYGKKYYGFHMGNMSKHFRLDQVMSFSPCNVYVFFIQIMLLCEQMLLLLKDMHFPLRDYTF